MPTACSSIGRNGSSIGAPFSEKGRENSKKVCSMIKKRLKLKSPKMAQESQKPQQSQQSQLYKIAQQAQLAQQSQKYVQARNNVQIRTLHTYPQTHRQTN